MKLGFKICLDIPDRIRARLDPEQDPTFFLKNSIWSIYFLQATGEIKIRFKISNIRIVMRLDLYSSFNT